MVRSQKIELAVSHQTLEIYNDYMLILGKMRTGASVCHPLPVGAVRALSCFCQFVPGQRLGLSSITSKPLTAIATPG